MVNFGEVFLQTGGDLPPDDDKQQYSLRPAPVLVECRFAVSFADVHAYS